MRSALSPILLLAFIAPACGGGTAVDSSDSGTAPDAGTQPDGGAYDAEVTGPDSGTTTGSPGCGLTAQHPSGGVNVELDVGPAGDGLRRFHLSLPASYDPDTPHRLVFGFPGTDWLGEQIRPYLGLEQAPVDPRDDEIFVYLDPLWRDFEGWGNYGGWVLGPHAYPAHGEQDFAFVRAVADHLENNYCIDSDRIFATGHSWGGDMAMVVGCFLGDLFRATAPVAANRPYWFEPAGGGDVTCTGDTAVWVFFGEDDTHFTWQSYPGEFGDECRDFWLAENDCDSTSEFTELGLGNPGECVEYTGCNQATRYCLYGASYGHQIPSAYFASETMRLFRSF